MAKKPVKTEDDDSSKAKKAEGDKKLLLELRERYTKCVKADKENRDRYRANMKFTLVPGEQWDETSKKERGKDRVMYEFNETRIKCKAVVNQIRSNRPSAKITPAEDGDIELAEAMKAQIDQIQNASDADSIMDYATEHQVIGGMGAERYVTRWTDDAVDQQDIVIEPVKNPMCLYADYACQKQDKSDARFWFYAAKLAKDVFKQKYPKEDAVEFDVEDDFDDDCDDEHVWVAEYWKQVPITRRLALLSDGKTVDMATITALPEGVTIVKERAAASHKIVQYICSGDAVLEGPNEWAGKHFPFNIAYGEYAVIDGKDVWYGLPEHGKDAQRAHNWAATSVYEAIASTPQGTTWVTADQADGGKLLGEWNEAVRKNIRIKRYVHDPKQPGPPTSEPPATVPTALVAAMQMSSDSLKAVLGMPDATLGEKGAENSGVAIRRRQEAGAVANYNFGDNMTKFARRRCEILIDLIPKVMDTPRSIRVLGKDGSDKWVKINQFDPVTGEVINDLSAAKFDLVVTQGPSFATQRQEAAETYMGMQQANPLLGQVAGDLIFKSLDLPFAQEIGERLKASLPPPIAAMVNGDKPQDPAVVAAMQQVELLQAQLQEQAALVEEASTEAQGEKAAADKAKADLQVQAANVKTQEAVLAQSVAEFKTLVAETQVKMAESQQTTDGENERETLTAQLAQALADIQTQAAGIMQALSEQVANFQMAAAQSVTPQVVIPPRPRIVRVVKQNGAMVPVYDDQVVN
jgi:Phage P22-like portal protein